MTAAAPVVGVDGAAAAAVGAAATPAPVRTAAVMAAAGVRAFMVKGLPAQQIVCLAAILAAEGGRRMRIPTVMQPQLH